MPTDGGKKPLVVDKGIHDDGLPKPTGLLLGSSTLDRAKYFNNWERTYIPSGVQCDGIIHQRQEMSLSTI
jgi:hypothetical protein